MTRCTNFHIARNILKANLYIFCFLLLRNVRIFCLEIIYLTQEEKEERSRKGKKTLHAEISDRLCMLYL